MNGFTKSLLEKANKDIEMFHPVSEDLHYSSYDQYESYTNNREWLFSVPTTKVKTGDLKKDSASISAAKRKFIQFLHRNLAMGGGVHGDGLAEKYISLQEGLHSKKLRNTNNADYYTAYFNPEVCNRIRGIISSRISGESNPAYGHGGKFSPYSKKFVKYDGLTEQEKEAEINSVQQQREKTVEDNPHRNPKRPEYYIHNYGMTYDEAVAAVSESQVTFSLEKCIEKYGEVEGQKRWKERQERWMNTMNKKSLSEWFEITRKKASSPSLSQLASMSGDTRSVVYFALSSDGMYMKIGHTNDLRKRLWGVKRLLGRDISFCLFHEVRLEDAYELESVLVESLSKHSVLMNEEDVNGVKSSETFIVSDQLIEELNNTLDDLGVLDSLQEYAM